VTELEVCVPSEVADALEAAGVVEQRSEILAKRAGDYAGVVLTVYNVTLSIVTLGELPGRVAALRDALLSWINGPDAPDKPYMLEAHGPGGRLSYELDSPPNLDALQSFLERVNIGDLDSDEPSDQRA
jgi:hypothetical protein